MYLRAITRPQVHPSSALAIYWALVSGGHARSGGLVRRPGPGQVRRVIRALRHVIPQCLHGVATDDDRLLSRWSPVVAGKVPSSAARIPLPGSDIASWSARPASSWARSSAAPALAWPCSPPSE